MSCIPIWNLCAVLTYSNSDAGSIRLDALLEMSAAPEGLPAGISLPLAIDTSVRNRLVSGLAVVVQFPKGVQAVVKPVETSSKLHFRFL